MRIFPQRLRHSMPRLRAVAARPTGVRPFIAGSSGASTIGAFGGPHVSQARLISRHGGGIDRAATVPAFAALGVGAFAPPAALAETSPVEKAQFVWGGRKYCWYNSAWRGPGWYWCGYAWRRGFGWGGAAGWHGWHPGSWSPIATASP